MGIINLFHLDIYNTTKNKSTDNVVLYGIDLRHKIKVQFRIMHPISLTLAVSDLAKFIKLIHHLPSSTDVDTANNTPIQQLHVSNIKVTATNFDYIDQMLNEPGTEMNEHLYLVKLDFFRYSDLYHCHKFLNHNKWSECFILPKYVHNLYQMISYDILFGLTETIYQKTGSDHSKFNVFEHQFHADLLPSSADFLIYQGCVVQLDERTFLLTPEPNHECLDPETYIPLISFDIETICDNLLDVPLGMMANDKMVFFGIYSDFMDQKFCWIYYLNPDDDNTKHKHIEQYLRREIEEAVAPHKMFFVSIRHFQSEEDLFYSLLELLSFSVSNSNNNPDHHISHTLTGISGWPYFLVCHNFLGYDLPFLISRHMILGSKLAGTESFTWTPVGGHTHNRQETHMLIDTDNYRFDPYGLTIDSMYVFKRQGAQNISLNALTTANLPPSQRKMSSFDVVSIRVPFILNNLPLAKLQGAESHIAALKAFLYPAFDSSTTTGTEAATHVLKETQFPFLFKKFYPKSRKLAQMPKTTNVQPFYMGLVYQFWDVYSLHCLTKQSSMIGYCQNMAHYTQLPIDLAAVARVSCSIPRLIGTFAMGRYSIYTDLLSNIDFKMMINNDTNEEELHTVYPIFHKAMNQRLQQCNRQQQKKNEQKQSNNQIDYNFFLNMADNIHDDDEDDDDGTSQGVIGDDGNELGQDDNDNVDGTASSRKINMSWYPGAVVLTKPGIYTHVHQFDWNSYYPSMCVAFNLAPDNVSLVRAKYLKNLLWRLSIFDTDDSAPTPFNLRADICNHMLQFYIHCYIAEENVNLHADHDREMGYYHYLNNHAHQVGRLVCAWTDLVHLAETTPNAPLMIRSFDRSSSWPVPGMLRQFMCDRFEMKRQLKIPGVAQAKPYLKSREKAVKILINSTYGVFKFFAKMIGPSITLYCRKILIHMCRVAPALYLKYMRDRGGLLFGHTAQTRHLANTHLDAYINYVRMLSPFTYQQHLDWSTNASYCPLLHDFSKARIIDADTDSFQIIIDHEDLEFNAETFAKEYLNQEMIYYCGGEWGSALKLEPLSEKERHHLLILIKMKRYIGLETKIDARGAVAESFSLFPKSPFSYKRVNIGKNAIAPIKHILSYVLDTLVLYHYFYSADEDNKAKMQECFAQTNFYLACFEYLHNHVDREQLVYPVTLNRISTNTPRKHYIDSVTTEYGGGRTMDTFFVYDPSPNNKYHFTFATKKAFLDKNLRVGDAAKDSNHDKIYFPEYLKNYVKLVNDIVNAVLNTNLKWKIDELYVSYLDWMKNGRGSSQHVLDFTAPLHYLHLVQRS